MSEKSFEAYLILENDKPFEYSEGNGGPYGFINGGLKYELFNAKADAEAVVKELNYEENASVYGVVKVKVQLVSP